MYVEGGNNSNDASTTSCGCVFNTLHPLGLGGTPGAAPHPPPPPQSSLGSTVGWMLWLIMHYDCRISYLWWMNKYIVMGGFSVWTVMLTIIMLLCVHIYYNNIVGQKVGTGEILMQLLPVT